METRTRAHAVHRTKPELIAHELRSLIIGGEYLPGQRLILRELASEFACSEIPVREALNTLASARVSSRSRRMRARGFPASILMSSSS